MESKMKNFSVDSGMPLAIFQNKYARRDSGEYEDWASCVNRVVLGNLGIIHGAPTEAPEFKQLANLAKQGILPFSGRHLQHGDSTQKTKYGEYFTNCSTAMFSFMVFYLLLKGSGVGRCYDSNLCYVDWDYMPQTRFVLDAPDNNGKGGHPDYQPWIESLVDAQHKYDSEGEHVRWFTIKDSAEGWVDIIKILETAAFHRNNKDNLFIFDFSKIRPAGSPIKKQQNRPSSGPVPLIRALHQVASIRGSQMKPWKQALYIDHYLASCVVSGGIRRSARMATKYWKDRDVIDFIDIKRGGFLYTANNSITVDKEFWDQAQSPKPSHARRILDAATSAAYFDNTGEPGFINVDMLEVNNEGIEDITSENYITSTNNLDVSHPKTLKMFDYVLKRSFNKKYHQIVNPCSEITLSVWGGYCVIGDISLAHVTDLSQAIEAAKELTKFLIRVNKLDFLYNTESKRTNRIGVGLTGIFEFAYKHFKYNFFDLIEYKKSKDFWDFIASMRQAAYKVAEEYATKLEMNIPHTIFTIKPSGTISKVMNVTEGAHLPAYGYYMRWVQEQKNNPEIELYRKKGYPIKDISHQYPNTVVIGFPTSLPISELMGDKLVTSDMVTWEQQTKWIQLLEKYWIGTKRGNQVSFTLKYDPNKITYEEFRDLILQHQSTVKCCSVMPQVDYSAYAYIPEEKITRQEYLECKSNLLEIDTESYSEENLECEKNACPI